MSVLKVNQIKSKLRQLFESHLDLSDISAVDPEREPKVLSRSLAALAIMLQTGCPEKDAAAAVWDGSDDNGIDAAYYDVSDSRVILVQSKWIGKGAGEPEAKELGTFTKGVWALVEQDHTLFHQRLQARLNDITLRLAVPGTSVHLVVVSTGASSLAKHGTDVLDKCLAELNVMIQMRLLAPKSLGWQRCIQVLRMIPHRQPCRSMQPCLTGRMLRLHTPHTLGSSTACS